MEEIWKPIFVIKNGKNYDFSSNYEVSSFGNIRNKKTGLFLKSRLKKDYAVISLRKTGNRKIYNFFVHQIVAQNFILNPNKFSEINHIDGNKHNNKIDNIEWCSRNINMQHAYNNGLISYKKAKFNALKASEKISIKVNQYDSNWKYIKTFNSLEEDGRNVGCSGNMIKKYCKRKDFYISSNYYRWRYFSEHPECNDLMEQYSSQDEGGRLEI